MGSRKNVLDGGVGPGYPPEGTMFKRGRCDHYCIASYTLAESTAESVKHWSGLFVRPSVCPVATSEYFS